MLFPYFGFLVVANSMNLETNTRTITLQEIPMQNNLSTQRISLVSQFRLLWVGSNRSDFEQFQNLMSRPPYKSKLIGMDLAYSADETEAVQLVQSAVKVILVVSNVIGKTFIQNIEGGLEKCRNILGAVCYCYNVQDNTKFFEKYSLVKHVVNDKNILIEKCFDLRKEAFKNAGSEEK